MGRFYIRASHNNLPAFFRLGRFYFRTSHIDLPEALPHGAVGEGDLINLNDAVVLDPLARHRIVPVSSQILHIVCNITHIYVGIEDFFWVKFLLYLIIMGSLVNQEALCTTFKNNITYDN